MAQYKYSALESAEHIRFLKIGKNNLADGSKPLTSSFDCEILPLLLDEALAYETLSYACGNRFITGNINP